MAVFIQDLFRRLQENFISLDEQSKTAPTCTQGLDQAVEFVVAEISSKLRAVPGHARRLRKPVTASFHYIDEMVEQVPGVVTCRRSTFVEDPRVNAFFVNPEHLQETFSQSREVRDLFDSSIDIAQCYALLCMHREERERFGVALVGDAIRRDVAQTTVSFANHQLVSPGADEADARCALKCCIFRNLIGHIGARIASAGAKTSELNNRRRVAQNRLRQFDRHSRTGVAREGLVSEIAAIEEEWRNRRPRLDSLEDYLRFTVDALSHPERFLSSRRHSIHLDRMGIKLESSDSAAAYELPLAEIRTADQPPRVAVLVSFPREELLPERDFLREASAFLAV